MAITIQKYSLLAFYLSRILLSNSGHLLVLSKTWVTIIDCSIDLGLSNTDIISQNVRISEVCDQKDNMVSKNDKSCYIRSRRLDRLKILDSVHRFAKLTVLKNCEKSFKLDLPYPSHLHCPIYPNICLLTTKENVVGKTSNSILVFSLWIVSGKKKASHCQQLLKRGWSYFIKH